MVQLCSNREEGFGPSSNLASPLPTTCFTDTILIPLPVWFYLLIVAFLFASIRHHRPHNFNPSAANLRAGRRSAIKRAILKAVYYFFIIVNILMQTLEIVRLCLIDFGIGLLPFTYVALILGVVLRVTDGFRGRIEQRMWMGANCFVWIGLMIVSVVKTAGLVKMENNGIYRTGSKYPMADQVTDVAIIAGLYLIIAVSEVWLGMELQVGKAH